jgi:hypothetical protein
VGSDDVPHLPGEDELAFPHPRVDGKGMQENESAAMAGGGRRQSFEIADASGGRHPPTLSKSEV